MQLGLMYLTKRNVCYKGLLLHCNIKTIARKILQTVSCRVNTYTVNDTRIQQMCRYIDALCHDVSHLYDFAYRILAEAGIFINSFRFAAVPILLPAPWSRPRVICCRAETADLMLCVWPTECAGVCFTTRTSSSNGGGRTEYVTTHWERGWRWNF